MTVPGLFFFSLPLAMIYMSIFKQRMCVVMGFEPQT